jgi:hypothetical protein
LRVAIYTSLHASAWSRIKGGRRYLLLDVLIVAPPLFPSTNHHQTRTHALHLHLITRTGPRPTVTATCATAIPHRRHRYIPCHAPAPAPARPVTAVVIPHHRHRQNVTSHMCVQCPRYLIVSGSGGWNSANPTAAMRWAGENSTFTLTACGTTTGPSAWQPPQIECVCAHMACWSLLA